jgi:hypothetical protein
MKKKHNEIRVERVVENEDDYILYYQEYRNGIAVGSPFTAYVTKEEYKVVTIKALIMREFEVPEHLVDKLISAARDAKERDDIDTDVYEEF